VSTYNPTETLHRFASNVVDGETFVDRAEVTSFRRRHAGSTSRRSRRP